MIFISLLSLFLLCNSQEELTCKRRNGGIPLPLGVFAVQKEGYPDVSTAINIAMDHIKTHSCLLLGYSLQLIVKDTQCKTSHGVKALFELIASRPRPVAILGGICTQVNEPIAMALKYWKIVQLSYAETHAKFASSDSHDLFPTFFRIVPGSRNTNTAKCRMITHFNWKRIGTIKQSDHARYSLPHEVLATKLEHGFGVKVIYTAGVNREQADSISNGLAELKERDARVIVADVDKEMAATLLCAAFHKGMYGPNYVWIMPEYHSSSWMTSENCTEEEMKQAADNHFAIEFALTRRDSDTVVASNLPAKVVWEELSKNDEDNILRGYLYDSLWTLAMGIHKAMDENGDFSHEKMMEAMNEAEFEGVTGKVKFINNERLGLVNILQYQHGQYQPVAVYDGADDRFEVFENAFGSWKPPLDATVVEYSRQHITFILYLAMSLLALIGISLALIFLLINVRYRNHRFIKMSSPNLNNIIIAGSIFTFASVILLGLDTRILSQDMFVIMCYIKTWTLCLGFTFAFGAMFSKTWRVHAIFTNIRMNRKAIKDSKLLLIIGMLLMTDLVVLTAWMVISPFSFKITQLPHIIYDNRVVIPEVEKCQSSHSGVFQAILYAIKGILMILGCFLAWETRHVNVPALNDSKYIGMSVYSVVVMSVLGLSTSVILQERVDESFALASFFVIFSTTLTLCLVFVPKVVELARNPSGTEPRAYRRGLMKSVVAKTSQATSPATENAKDMLTKAESENKVRRRYLHQKSAQLYDLLEKLRQHGDTQFLAQDWCMSCPTPSSFDRYPLLGNSSNTRDETSTSAAFDNDDDWPWVDPDEPSTRL